MNRTIRTMTALLGLSLSLSTQASAGAVPASLVGEWHSGSTSTMGYENISTGVWTSARASSFTLKLAADGSYQYVGIMVVKTAGCDSKIYNAEKGKATVSGGKLSLKPAGGDAQYYVCDPKNVKKGTLNSTDWTWKVGKDSSGKEALFLGDVSGKGQPTAYYRQGKAASTGTAAPAAKPATPVVTKPAASAPRTITGTLTAAKGHSLKGTVIIACPNGDCDSDDVKGAVIESASSTATFTLKDLGTVGYAVYAVQDLDGDEDVSKGDWVDRNLLQDKEAVLTKVGTAGAKLELVEVK
ncbi:hypothetical protein [Deinococcus apachensis]|uniref:hypothetical protein n=1 Tax=Deinococcus apachensis TaxID=309886 RepID=UPI00037CDEBA|nr:hypothetical protein [Deinococcus apachensis]